VRAHSFDSLESRADPAPGRRGEPILTVRQPWASAIFHAGKDIENRVWPTDYRGRLWIHAGLATARAEPDRWAEEHGLWLPEEPLPRGVKSTSSTSCGMRIHRGRSLSTTTGSCAGRCCYSGLSNGREVSASRSVDHRKGDSAGTAIPQELQTKRGSPPSLSTESACGRQAEPDRSSHAFTSLRDSIAPFRSTRPKT
jgi:hypothetical protein